MGADHCFNSADVCEHIYCTTGELLKGEYVASQLTWYPGLHYWAQKSKKAKTHGIILLKE